MGTTVGVFNKGIHSDTDSLYLEGESYDLLENGELELTASGMLVVKSIRGTKEVLSIVEDGYALKPIAWEKIDNMLFVLAQNGSKSYLGYVVLTQLPLDFVPLMNMKDNITDSSIRIFKTTSLGYTESSVVQMHLKKMYDASINIYLNDGVNTSYVINTRTCFRTSGNISNSFVYIDDSFTCGKAMHFMGTKLPQVQSLLVLTGGEMKPGVYTFFLRYLDAHGNKTKYFFNTKPITIAPNNNTEERVPIPNSKEDTAKTDKKVSIQFTMLNAEYDKLELAYIRQYNTGDAELVESKLVDNKFKIDSTGNLTVYITGAETKIDTTIEEIYKTNPITTSWKTSIVKNGRMFMGGLKQNMAIEESKCINFFKRIVPKFSLASNIKFGVSPVDDVGYFDEQIYQFVGYFIYSDLTTSNLYPLAGYYTDGTYNSSGFVKVPKLHVDNYDPTKNIAVSFNINTAVIYGFTALDYYNAYFTIDEKKKIVGFNVLRSDRVDNLLYSGIITPTTYRVSNAVPIDFAEYNGQTFIRDGIDVGYGYGNSSKNGVAGTEYKYVAPWGTSQSYKTAYHFPFYKGIAPGYIVPGTFFLVSFVSYTAADNANNMRLAFYSPDVMLNSKQKLSNGDDVYVTIVSQPIETVLKSDLSTDNPCYHGQIMNRSVSKNISYRATAYVVPEETSIGPGNFSSYVKDYFNVGKKSGELFMYNQVDIPSRDSDVITAFRSNMTTRYIGLELKELTQQSFYSLYDKYFYYANIYKNLNDESFYNNLIGGESSSRSYYLIDSPFISDNIISNPSAINNKLVYGGDCHTKWFQFLLNKSAEFGGSDVTGEPEEWTSLDNSYGKANSDGINNCHGTSIKKYSFGMLMSYIGYSVVNPAARCVTDEKSYFEAENGKLIPVNNYTYTNPVKMYVQSGSPKYYKESHSAYTSFSKQALLFRVSGVDKMTGADANRYSSSVIYSDTEGALEVVDSYRNVDFSKLRTFAPGLGGICAMVSYKDYIYVIHKSGVTLHTSEMQMQQVNDAKVVSIGSGEILPSIFMQLGSYGAQSINHVVLGKKGLYGYDSITNLIWIIDFESLQQYDLPKLCQATKFIKNYVADYGEAKPLSTDPQDYPYLYNDDTCDSIVISLNEYNVSFFFNEGIFAFTHSMTEAVRLSFGYGKVQYLYSIGDIVNKNKIFAFNGYDKSERLNIFGHEKTFIFVVRTNGGKEDAGLIISKLFNTLLITSPYIVFDRIRFFTDYMVGDYDIFFNLGRTDFWNNPEWKENKWVVPMLVKTDQKYGHAPIPVSSNDQYVFGIDPNTEIRGLWAGVEIQFDGNGKDDREILIDSMVFNYKKSEL
jgi:hypothetical protein